jgi:PAS domain S-box-containing protein
VPPVRLRRWMKLCLILCFLILRCNGPCVSVAHAQGQPQTDLKTKTILVLHSHEANAPVFLGTDRGLLKTLESGGIPRLNQIYESLELRRYPFPEHRRLLVEQLRLRYSQRKIDMIVTMYPEALEFVLKDCAEVFPDIPVLALYLPEGFAIKETDRRIIGHSASLDIIGTFQIALKLLPKAKRVYVVSGAHEVDRMRETKARRELKGWEAHLKFHYLGSLPFDEILTTLTEAPPDSIILQLAFSQDVAGNSYTAQDLTQQFSRVAAAPIFGLLDVALGHGITGGSLISFEKIGAKASELILDILRGASVTQNLPNTLEAASLPMFDWRQLHRWNLSVNDLPEGSTIINREYTLWDLKYYILAALSFVLAQSCLILMLLAQKRRLQSAEESLRNKTEELDRFFSVTLDLLCIANTGGYFLRLNPAWEKVLGYSREEFMANRFYDFVHPDDLAGTQEAVSKLASQRELVHFENRYRCIDGSYRFLNWTAASVGEIIYAAARDMTERLEVETEARQRRDELAHLARVSMMGELTASLAHEINQPLSAIMSNAQAAKRYLNTPAPDMEEVKEIINDIVKEDTRAGEIINRMRALLKKTKMELEPVDLNSVFREIGTLLNSDAVMRDIKIDLEFDPQLPFVRGDRVQLQQVALNLVLNAFDAMSGRPRGERWVLIRTGLKDSQVLAAVTDNGTGVSTEDPEKVFQPFFTTKTQGLGMGLSISRSIIIRHQGRIWAENNPGSGTTFYFSLPVTG